MAKIIRVENCGSCPHGTLCDVKDGFTNPIGEDCPLEDAPETPKACGLNAEEKP